jgi:transcription termination factor Rho
MPTSIEEGRQVSEDQPAGPNATRVEGLLELHPDGYGFIRTFQVHFQVQPADAYVPADVIRRFELREGLKLVGESFRPPEAFFENGHQRGPQRYQRGPGRGDFRNGGGRNQQQRPQQRRQQGPRLQRLISVEGMDPEEYRGRPTFDRLTPIDPRKWLRLETATDRLTTRVVDMFCPIGMGTRGLIVAPPRTGKTILIQHIADAVADNHPNAELIVLLVDERPEEVTEMRRTIRGSVYASSNDQETSSHVRVAELAMERAKRLAETGKDVVVLLDSITRLARAYNKHAGNSGRTMSGGLDIRALETPKRLLGAARAFDEGGSLTILATALIETGSRMDDVIFQEFKGTGNMELVLDRKLADRRIYPAINISQSGTRKEERLLPSEMLERITLLRRSLLKLNDVDAMESLQKQMKKHETNDKFLAAIGKYLQD